MTEDEREAGRWQGNVSARLESIETQMKHMPIHAERLTKLESRQSVMWSGLAASALMAGGAVFKLWAAGGF